MKAKCRMQITGILAARSPRCTMDRCRKQRKMGNTGKSAKTEFVHIKNSGEQTSPELRLS
jgi:hypothetical protein